MGKRSKTYILKIMTKLLLLWMKYPYLRFCQLIENAFHHIDYPCIYYIEDEEFINKLEETYRETNND